MAGTAGLNDDQKSRDEFDRLLPGGGELLDKARALAQQQETGPYWDKQRERWVLIVHHGAHNVEHREVANPVTGIDRDPPAGVNTRPKQRSSRRPS